jgi:hypothetical protein
VFVILLLGTACCNDMSWRRVAASEGSERSAMSGICKYGLQVRPGSMLSFGDPGPELGPEREGKRGHVRWVLLELARGWGGVGWGGLCKVRGIPGTLPWLGNRLEPWPSDALAWIHALYQDSWGSTEKSCTTWMESYGQKL